MADTFTKKQRSHVMRQVKSNRNKSTELKVIEYFKANKIIGWRRNHKLFGKPDFVFPKHRVAIFLDGCFWHGHNCRNTKPKDNEEYWIAKINRNKSRDELVSETLSKTNWRVLRLWECELKDPKRIADTFKF